MSNSRLLVTRMIRAAKLDSHLYEEVEADRTANWQAFQVVLMVSLAIGVGAAISTIWADDPPSIFWPFLVLVVAHILAWMVWACLTWILGTMIFKGPETSATYDELLRTIGFAHAPLILGFLIFIPGLGVLLYYAAGIWALIAAVIAVRQALDFSTGRAIGPCVLGWIAHQMTLGLIGLAVT